MMEYGLFKQLMAERIKEFLPPVFSGYRVDIRQVEKINQTKDAFCLFPPEQSGSIAVPTLYLDDMYADFSEDEDLDRVLKAVAAVLIRWSGIEVPELADYRLEDHTDAVVANLISREMNRPLLEKVPWTPFLDMAIVYRLIHSINENGINSAIINHEMIKGTDLSAQRLHELAMRNTPRLFPVRIYDGSEDGVYVMTNESGVNGATTLLYEEDMQKLAGLIGGDFFILPSSMHEFFAISAEGADPVELVKMLAAGNATITQPEDQLSTVIYRYSEEEEKVSKVIGYLK